MPPLRFAPYREIAHEVAVRLLASREGVGALAPWSEEVVVPSRGVAEAIVAEVLARLPNGVAGLQIRTLEELAQYLLASAGRTPRVASEAERRLAMRTAVRAVDHPMMESRGIAAMLDRAYRDVRDSGITLAELTKRVGRTRELRNGRRTEAILRAWREYEKLIGQLGAIDGADRLALASSSDVPETPSYLIAGFYDMTGAQLRLTEALLRADRVGAVWVPTEAPFAQTFVRAMTAYAEVARDPVIEIRKAQLDATQFDTRALELREVCARVAELLANGTPAREIGIVARSLEPYDTRLLNRFAAEHGFATSMPDEIPLTAHRIGRGVRTLLRLRERGFPRSEVLELVRDGLLTRTRIHVNDADAATRRARIAGGTSEELRAMRQRSRPIDDYLALVEELEQLTAMVDLDFLSRLGGMFRIDTSADLEAAERLDEVAALFRRAAAWGKGLDVNAVIDAIEQVSLVQRNDGTNGTDSPMGPIGPIPVVWAGEILRFRGRSFTHLFTVRMQDDVFPQRRTEDPLLPDSDRALLGMREIGDGREEEALLFSLLSDASPNVHFSYAVGDGFGKVLRASRYLRGETAGRRPADRPAESRRSVRSARPLQLLVKSGTRSFFDGYIGAANVQLQSLSPTQLEDFGECPQKFFFKHILGAVDIDQPERELQIHPREKGTADHEVLERFYRAMSEDDIARAAAALPKLPDDVAARLDGIIDDAFVKLAETVPPFNHTIRDIERRATKRLLREFLAHDLTDLAEEGLVPRWFEYRFGAVRRGRGESDHPEPFVVHAGGVPVKVEGTVDRIDQGVDRYRIVDYKSGKALRHSGLADKIDRGVRLQLALYAMAVTEFFGADPAHVTATIKPLVVNDLKLEKFAFALHEKRDALLQTLEIFMRAILGGEFPAFPNENDDFNSCKYCPVNHSCRTRHDLDESYAVRQFRDPRTLLSHGPGGGAA
ncbi:MAG TPA: PD-(D/E)XK nuclease family protein [Thermoanaerobaculia bacterium]|nr:PD-(D/E)XK nuclease family protein [Thermoanaerobaculia bacterium]